MSHKTVSGVLASAIADAGTFTVSYPPLQAPETPYGVTDAGYFYKSRLHKLVMGGAVLLNPKQFTVTLGTSSITITNKTGASWPAGTAWTLELQEPGKGVYTDQGLAGTGAKVARMSRADVFRICLGAPDALVTNGICQSQNRTGAGVLVLDGSLVVGGQAVFDVPRNVIADSGGADTAVITVTGYDEYDNLMKEAITLNGTTAVPGKKAFKRVTGVSSSATITNGFFLGTGDVLGLPVFLPAAGWILKELQDGAAATAGTTVAGDTTAGGSTATTGDVRGTYDPNAACDGSKVFELIVALPEPGDLGMPQYAG